MTTDKASVAAALMASPVFRNMRGTEGDAKDIAGDILSALSPAQGDGMRDALVKEFQRFMQVCGEGGRRGRAIDCIDREDWQRAHNAIKAALASHPDRQPGMTDEDREAAFHITRVRQGEK